MTDHRDPADITDPSEKADPIEKAERNEPIDPMDPNDPTEPIDRTEPLLPIDRTESSDHNDHRELVALPVSTARFTPSSWRDRTPAAVRWGGQHHSDRSNTAVGVRAALRPGSAATMLASTTAPTATITTDTTGTVASGTA
jgi:hypothetical protein